MKLPTLKYSNDWQLASYLKSLIKIDTAARRRGLKNTESVKQIMEQKLKQKCHFAGGRLNFSECMSLCLSGCAFALFCLFCPRGCASQILFFYECVTVRLSWCANARVLECSMQDQAQREIQQYVFHDY